MRRQTRYKSVVVPILNGKYLSVNDVKNDETTFVVGGCKQKESSKTCALRELREETYGALGEFSDSDLVRVGEFYSRDRSRSELNKDLLEGVFVTMKYTVYFLYVDKHWTDVKRTYYANMRRSTHRRETNGIYLLSKNDYETRLKMWEFMRKNVLPFLR